MARTNLLKSQLFLMEFVLVVMFFALCSVICISMFMKAETISRNSLEINRGLMLAQSAAECIKASEPEELQGNMGELLSLKKAGDDSFVGYYNEDFSPATEGEKVFCVRVKIYRNEDMLTARIAVKEEGIDTKREICHLEVKKYLPAGQTSGRQEWM